jgi:hypothetical protein
MRNLGGLAVKTFVHLIVVDAHGGLIFYTRAGSGIS